MGEKIFYYLSSFLFIFIALEFLLNIFPVNESFNFVEVNKTNDVFKAQKNRLVYQSKFWYFYNAQEVKVNNFGFRNDNNYSKSEENIIAVIGDSYVEAVQVPFKKTFFNILDESLGDKYKVYSFGFSGAPLSQYLKWAEYAISNFNVKYLVFNIVGNDFDESMHNWKNSPGFHYFKKCTDGNYCLFQENLTKTNLHFLKKSSLFSYIIYNLQFLKFKDNFKYSLKNILNKNDSNKYFGNVPYKVSSERIIDSKVAIRLFFKYLKKLDIPKNNIVSIVDGRFYSNRNKYKGSFFYQMRENFFMESINNGYTYIDLSEMFGNNFKENNKRFEFPKDSHWNELGHLVVGKTLIDYYNKIIK